MTYRANVYVTSHTRHCASALVRSKPLGCKGNPSTENSSATMPTYRYACKNWGRHLGSRAAHRADPITECPSCHQPRLRSGRSAPATSLFSKAAVGIPISIRRRNPRRKPSRARRQKRGRRASQRVNQDRNEVRGRIRDEIGIEDGSRNQLRARRPQRKPTKSRREVTTFGSGDELLCVARRGRELARDPS